MGTLHCRSNFSVSIADSLVA
uniref:Uncharacterized protein n=1 Tax=Anguilla anguilla TaxID=7936 RepID=A0A0E9TE63_ANGAN